MAKVERWVEEHRERPEQSTLRHLVKTVGWFFTPLPLVKALKEYDVLTRITARRFVTPNFAEVRHILNIAQVHAIADSLKLLTFDADGTLYEDGAHLEEDSAMIARIISLLQRGISVVIVTAAGYPGRPDKFEGRLSGLLSAFEELKLPHSLCRNFFVMGGECNYLLRATPDWRLEMVDPNEWQTQEMLSWGEREIQGLLDEAQSLLLGAADRLGVKVQLVRKERAVGVVPVKPTMFEALEDIALAVQADLSNNAIPFCCFNGGNDVFFDVGNKNLGLNALMHYTQSQPQETLFVGDRFTVTGNDSNVKGCCPILWVANPDETAFFMHFMERCFQERSPSAVTSSAAVLS